MGKMRTHCESYSVGPSGDLHLAFDQRAQRTTRPTIVDIMPWNVGPPLGRPGIMGKPRGLPEPDREAWLVHRHQSEYDNYSCAINLPWDLFHGASFYPNTIDMKEVTQLNP